MKITDGLLKLKKGTGGGKRVVENTSVIAILVVILFLVGILVYTLYMSAELNYYKAELLLERGDYLTAAQTYTSVNVFRDASERRALALREYDYKSQYEQAKQLYYKGYYESAMEKLVMLQYSESVFLDMDEVAELLKEAKASFKAEGLSD